MVDIADDPVLREKSEVKGANVWYVTEVINENGKVWVHKEKSKESALRGAEYLEQNGKKVTLTRVRTKDYKPRPGMVKNLCSRMPKDPREIRPRPLRKNGLIAADSLPSLLKEELKKQVRWAKTKEELHEIYLEVGCPQKKCHAEVREPCWGMRGLLVHEKRQVAWAKKEQRRLGFIGQGSKRVESVSCVTPVVVSNVDSDGVNRKNETCPHGSEAGNGLERSGSDSAGEYG